MIATWTSPNGTWHWQRDRVATTTDSATDYVARGCVTVTPVQDLYDRLAAEMAKEFERVRKLLARFFRTKKKRGEDTTPTALIHPSADAYSNTPGGGHKIPRPGQKPSTYG